MAVAVARPRPMLLPPLVEPPTTLSDKAARRIGPTAAPTRPAVALKNAMPVPRKLPGVTKFNAALAHAMNGDSTVRNRTTNARNSHGLLAVNASQTRGVAASNATAYQRN